MKNNYKGLFTTIIALLMAVTMLAGCAAVSTGARGAGEGDAQLSYVSIDINPSIELTLSEGLVIESSAYNEDGAAIVLSANVVGMTPQEAVTAIVNEFAAQGYIIPGDSSPAIVITVAGNKDAGLADTLKQNAEQSLTGLGLKAEVLATDVAAEMVQTAKNCGLSVGKYLVLKQISIKEGISIDEAKVKYGTLKMAELLAMVDKEAFIGDVEELSTFLNNLTPEQLQILTDARLAFQTAMKSAQEAFHTFRNKAKEAFMTARDAAKKAYIETKDKDALKAAKKEIKETFALAKKSATDGLKQSKIMARNTFYAAVSALGLDAETLEKLTDWDLDTGFDFDKDLDIEDEVEDQNLPKDNKGKGHKKNQGAREEDEDDD